MNAKGMTTKRTREFKLIAGIISASGLVIAALAFLTPQMIGTSNTGAGTVTSTAYTTLNMLLALIGGFMFAGGSAFILLKEDHETTLRNQPMVEKVPQAIAEEKSIEQPVELPSTDEMVSKQETENKERQVVLRLLSGDERAVFRAIIDAGGETYQKEIVTRTDMSDVKVSRVLDKLEEKGIIAKERHGMSNKVRIEIEE